MKDDPSGVASALLQHSNAFPSKSDPVLVAAFGDGAEKMAASLADDKRAKLAPGEIGEYFEAPFGDEKNRAFSYCLVLVDQQALIAEANNGDASKIQNFEKLLMQVAEEGGEKYIVCMHFNPSKLENGKDRVVARKIMHLSSTSLCKSHHIDHRNRKRERLETDVCTTIRFDSRQPNYPR
jgi:hypothetical protein